MNEAAERVECPIMWPDEYIRIDTVAEAILDPEHPRHPLAKRIVLAYTKRRKRSEKQAPPAYAVCIPPGNADIEACCMGWTIERGRFVWDSVGEGLGPERRRQARDNGWIHYEETWQSAHDALVAAGAIPG